MPYCPQCGVELEPAAPRCPLCGTPRREAGIAKPPQDRPRTGDEAPREMFPDTRDHALFTLDERKMIAWEVISVASGIAAITLAAINAAASGRLDWSLYPLASLGFAWIFATGVLVLERRPLVMFLSIFASIPLFLLALDAIEGGIGWSLSLGMPLALLAEAVVGTAAAIIPRLRRKGLNVGALLLFCTAFLLVGIEGLVNLTLYGGIILTWSLICLLALVPMAFFLLYLHFRIARSTNLRRMFRL